MTETRRLRLRCCNPDCKGIYYELTFELEPDTQPKLNVQCPYCDTGGTVTLNPYRIIRDDTILKTISQKQPKSVRTETWNFPSVVPVEPEEGK